MPDALELWAVTEGPFPRSFASGGGGELRRTRLPQDLHSLTKGLWVEGRPHQGHEALQGSTLLWQGSV